MKAVKRAIEDYREFDFDDASDRFTWTRATRKVTVLAIVGKWAMVREGGRIRPHVCDVANLTSTTTERHPPQHGPRKENK